MCVFCVFFVDNAYLILIPWVVIQELDRQKKSKNDSLALNATRARRYIYDQECPKNERLQGDLKLNFKSIWTQTSSEQNQYD